VQHLYSSNLELTSLLARVLALRKKKRKNDDDVVNIGQKRQASKNNTPASQARQRAKQPKEYNKYSNSALCAGHNSR